MRRLPLCDVTVLAIHDDTYICAEPARLLAASSTAVHLTEELDLAYAPAKESILQLAQPPHESNRSPAHDLHTYRHLIDARHRTRWTDRKIERSPYSNGLFVWYFGTQGRYEDVPHHSV